METRLGTNTHTTCGHFQAYANHGTHVHDDSSPTRPNERECSRTEQLWLQVSMLATILCLTLPGRQSPSKCVGLATNLFIMMVPDF